MARAKNTETEQAKVENVEETTEETKDKTKKEKIPPAKYPDKPINIKQVDYDYILDYIFDSEDKDIEWLKSLLNESRGKTKKGTDKRIPFIELRNKFVEEYMPEIIPDKQPPKPDMNDRFNQRFTQLRNEKAHEIRKRK